MADIEAQDIDIGDGCKRIERAQQNLRRGHSVQDRMEDTNPFSGDDNLYFERTFDFDCPEIPTSFYFRITFLRSRAQAVTTVACVRRTDQGAGLVDVRVETKVYRDGTEEAYARHFISGLGGPRRVDSEVRQIPLQRSPWSLQEESNLLVDFVLTVECCHREQEEEEAMDTLDAEDASPKKRLRVQSSS